MGLDKAPVTQIREKNTIASCAYIIGRGTTLGYCWVSAPDGGIQKQCTDFTVRKTDLDILENLARMAERVDGLSGADLRAIADAAKNAYAWREANGR